MSRYDGLIIPRSYSEYINKTDAATLQQALQLSGVLSGAVAAGDNKAVTSNSVYEALTGKVNQENCYVNYTYNLNGAIGGGNAFEINLYDYVRFNIGPLSNDYGVWKPQVKLYISVKNPANGVWSEWKAIWSASPF